MTSIGWLQILIYALTIFIFAKPLGNYMFRVFEGERQPLPRFFGPIERFVYRLSGVNARGQKPWKEYAAALLALSVFGVLVLYGLQRLQRLKEGWHAACAVHSQSCFLFGDQTLNVN
jgi:K+-transporting ATPase ATPase A chain